MDTLNLLYIQHGCFLEVYIIEQLMQVRGTQINDPNSQSFNNVLLKHLDSCSMQNLQLICTKQAFLYSTSFFFFFAWLKFHLPTSILSYYEMFQKLKMYSCS